MQRRERAYVEDGLWNPIGGSCERRGDALMLMLSIFQSISSWQRLFSTLIFLALSHMLKQWRCVSLEQTHTHTHSHTHTHIYTHGRCTNTHTQTHHSLSRCKVQEQEHYAWPPRQEPGATTHWGKLVFIWTQLTLREDNSHTLLPQHTHSYTLKCNYGNDLLTVAHILSLGHRSHCSLPTNYSGQRLYTHTACTSEGWGTSTVDQTVANFAELFPWQSPVRACVPNTQRERERNREIALLLSTLKLNISTGI